MVASGSPSVEETQPQSQLSYCVLGHSALANNPEVVTSGFVIGLRHCCQAMFLPNLRAHIILSKETSAETGTCSDDCNERHLKIIAER